MAAVTPVASVEQLERAIQRSGLLTAEGLAKVHEAAARHSDPKQLARELIKNGTLTRWQAEQLLHGFHRLIVGKYKLLDQIAASPTGRVYLAEHVQIGRRHALKVLARRLASNPQAVKRFLAAAQTACGLDHRNVSHCYDVTQDHERNSHYIVMEHVEGESLERLVERTGRLDPQLALNYAVQAADGLIHAHQNGVIHGDLKPGNLVLDHTGTIKILEMGQASSGATFEAEGADESVEMAALAAVIFQPPELRGDGEAPTIACDIYSLGSVLAYLLTAQAAPDAATAAERLKELADVPAELIELCQRMMADQPADRPKSVVEVADELVASAQNLAAAQSQAAAMSDTSASGKGKAKKPPVAKPLDGGGTAPLVIPGVTQPVIDSAAAPEPFVIKTKGRIGKKPATQPLQKPASESTAADSATAALPTTFTPLVLGAIGGGVFVVVGLLIAVICLLLFLSRRSKAPAVPSTPAAASQQSATPSAEEANPVAPAGEQNPEVSVLPASPEPAASAVPGTTQPDAASAPVEAADAAEPVASAPPPQESPAPPESLAPAEPAKTSAAKKTPEKAVAKSSGKPAAKSDAKTAPAKQAAKAPAKAEPFAGLAKAISLPPLPDQNGQPAPLATTVLGPCKLEDKTVLTARLVGGETAVRGTKHRFELQPKVDSNGAWEIVIDGVGEPSTIAALTAAEGNLQFAWLEEAGKQATIAKQLCNCAVQLVAGAAKHTLALRKPIEIPPLVIDIEKPGAVTRWAIGDLPLGKQMFVEVVDVAGSKGVLVEPKQAVGIGDDITIAFGETEEMLPLLVKLDTTTNSRDLEIKQQPSIKLEGQEPRLYRKNEVQRLYQQTMQQLTVLDAEITKTKNSRPRADLDKLVKEQKLDLLTKQRLTLGTIVGQTSFAIAFADDYRGAALVHLRVYYQGGEEKIELLRTLEDESAAKAK